MKRYRLSLPAAAGFGLLVSAAASLWFWNTTHRLTDAVFVLCPGAAFTALLLLGSDDALERLGHWICARPARVAAVPAGLWLLYLIYALGKDIAEVRAAITVAVYLGLPFLILWLRHLWLEPVAILWIWLPLEFGIVRRVLITATPGADLHYAFAQLLAIDAAIVAFAVWARTPDIGYRFEFDRSVLTSGLTNFFIFSAIGIPLGLAIRFIQYSFTVSKLYPAPLAFAGIFLFTALPEEFLFRGLIQNWIERVTGNRNVSLMFAALIFGASHLNNGPPIPNYKYFLMASVAGFFYGLAWRTTGSLMASSLTHALVDTFWSVFFR